MYLQGAIWHPKRRVAYMPVGVGFVLQWPWEDTTRLTIQLDFWQLSDDVILIMFGTS
jgi:hypothetical protein